MRFNHNSRVRRMIALAAVVVVGAATAAGATTGHITVDFDVAPANEQAAVDAVNASMDGTGASLSAGWVTSGWPYTDGSLFWALTTPAADDVRIDFTQNVDSVSIYIGAAPFASGAWATDAGANLVASDSFTGSGTFQLSGGCIRSVLIEHAGAALFLNDMVFHPMHDDSGCDDDVDGVLNGDDLCEGTIAGVADSAPELKHNRYASDASGAFVSGSGEALGITIADTGGCSASQVIEAAGLGEGHSKFGLSRGALLDWVAAI